MAARLRNPSAPLALLAIVSVLSLAVRLAWLDEPCRSPCTTAADHTLVFDESYYVNAARVIAGLKPPPGSSYAGSPAGVDPNSEHPQLAKLVIAGSIELLGDGPFAWRIGSILLGSLAILGMFALVRAAGGGRWPALAASALMAADNLMIVHGRIGTLDVYVLAAMLWAVVLYLRRRPLAGGVVLGIGACAKLVAPYAVFVVAVIELLRVMLARTAADGSWRSQLGGASKRLGVFAAAGAAVFLVLLDVMDRIAPPYNPNTHKLVTGGPLGHLGHMLSYQANLTSPHGPTGIASYPWEWLVDYKPITYLYINPARPTRGLYNIHPAVHFLGMVSPPIMLLALPGLAVAAWRLLRGGRPARIDEVPSRPDPNAAPAELAILALAWFAGTFLPFELLSVIDSRTSYLYYMVIVMPGIYAAIVHLFARWRPQRWVLVSWGALVLVAAILMYPFTPLP
jgi:4-amino-4-deoxy-L-arabinose transferase-like glycosyltransferase